MVYMITSIRPDSTHILADFKDCPEEQLISAELGVKIIKQAIDFSGLHEVNISSYQFKPEGYTVAALLSESHITLHTWPEYKAVQIDIFTCSSSEKCLKAYNKLKEVFKPGKIAHRCFKRNLDAIQEEVF